MDGITIRRARKGDLNAVAAIETQSFSDPWTPEVLHETLDYFPETFFVAEAGTHLAGFLVGGLEDTGEVVYGHICNFAVASPFRRLGVGSALVSRVERQFMVLLASGVQLEVRASNTAAMAFYYQLGYRQAFTIDGYYANGEDAHVMMKWFRF